jgi:hypothetical protein
MTTSVEASAAQQSSIGSQRLAQRSNLSDETMKIG